MQNLDTIEKSITESTLWEKVTHFLGLHLDLSKDISVSVLDVIVIILVIISAKYVLRLLLRLITRNLPTEDTGKFNVVFGYFRWLIYVVIFLITLHSVGVNVTAVFAASAALLIGVGLALQTLFQDIISGVFILIDQTVHVGDIVEVEGKIGRVEEIKLRTTRAVTIENKVLIIPNHLYLSNSLYNWTQNSKSTRESIVIGVAYGSDLDVVKQALLDVANSNNELLKDPKPTVLFTDFADSALTFELIFTIENSFEAKRIKSDLRFEIDRKFRTQNISIPFPQRDIHIINQNPNL